MWGGACRGERYRFRERRVFVERQYDLCESGALLSLWGRRLPCAELIIRKGIPRVVVGCLDPFPEVSGRGVRMLREAGVEVVTGVMEEEARALNKGVYDATNESRPYIILKWAQSEDGFIDRLRTDVSGAGHGFVFSGDFTLGA